MPPSDVPQSWATWLHKNGYGGLGRPEPALVRTLENRAMPLPRSRRRHAGGALLCLLGLLMAACALAAPAPVTLLSIDGPIGPASADYVVRGMARAATDGSQLVAMSRVLPLMVLIWAMANRPTVAVIPKTIVKTPPSLAPIR